MGMVLQKLKVETEVRALKFDDTGLFLIAGSKSGSIHVLEASDSSTLKFKFKVQLARGGVTCITFVPASYGQPPCLLVNSSDSSIFFNLLEDQLVTTSIDKSVRFWGIDTGEMLKVFTDSSPVPVATFLPFNPQVFVAANWRARK